MSRTYVGNADYRRLQFIEEYPLSLITDNTNPYGFIDSKGLLIKYSLECHGREMQSANYKNRGIYKIKFDDRWKYLERVEYEGDTYWVGVSAKLNCGDALYDIYKELPLIRNDNLFFWKEDPKHGCLIAVLPSGNFEYHCIYKADGDAVVDVKYVACENRHANKVTLATIDVIHASNEAICEAIAEWKEDFKRNF
jgi:hypothetical protein